jgi:hypothetical protein
MTHHYTNFQELQQQTEMRGACAYQESIYEYLLVPETDG